MSSEITTESADRSRLILVTKAFIMLPILILLCRLPVEHVAPHVVGLNLVSWHFKSLYWQNDI